MEAQRAADPRMAVWWGTPLECASAIARRFRSGELDGDGVDRAQGRLFQLSSDWTEIPATERLRDIALRLVRAHPLRAGDALQLASAMVLADGRPSAVPFVCLDESLCAAARLEGFRLAVVASAPRAHRKGKR